jgi:hypothetical protein
MSFLLDVRHWSTVAEFEAHLAGYDPAATAPWANGIVYHHTYRPLASQWAGAASISGLKSFYMGKGWDRGPHLFICSGAPRSSDDGIWQFTPLNSPGIHAGACNATHWGLEVVGDYDDAPWPPAVAELALGTGAALLRWRRLPLTPQSVRGHRDCLNNKSCPGRSIDMEEVRTLLAPLVAAAPVPPSPPTEAITADAPIIGPASCTQAQATAYALSLLHPNYTSADISLTIIPGYWSICTAVDANPAVGIAQLLQEGAMLSFWGARPRRNPAGIGVDGTTTLHHPAGDDDWAYNPVSGLWEHGNSFPSWVGHAIPAQVGRLLAYALTDDQASEAQQALIRTALSVRPLSRAARGSAPTLQPLGAAHNPANAGKPRSQWVAGWAWDGERYGAAIARHMEAMRQL